MSDGLLENKLDRLLGDDVLVVMDDDFLFLGILDEFDSRTLVLKKVLQAPSKQVDWKNISPNSKTMRDGGREGKKVGFMNWSEVNLEEVYVLMEHVTRIWNWGKKKKVEKTDGKVRRPIYYEKEYL
ncbi:MAG: hypothetical protein ACOCT7_00050 [Candidatus Saliniplasma sp.]